MELFKIYDTRIVSGVAAGYERHGTALDDIERPGKNRMIGTSATLGSAYESLHIINQATEQIVEQLQILMVDGFSRPKRPIFISWC